MTQRDEPASEKPALTPLPRVYWYHFSAGAVTALGNRVSAVAVPFVIADITTNAAVLGAVVATQWIPYVILGPFAGVLADRLNRQRLLIAADVVRAALFLLLGFLAISSNLTLPIAVLCLSAIGVFHAFGETTQATVIPTIVPDEDLARAHSYVRSAEIGARVTGPAAAGLLAVITAGAGLILDAVSYVAAGVFRLRVPDSDHKERVLRHGPNATLWREAQEGVRVVLANRRLTQLIGIGTVVNLGSAAILVSGVYLLYATEELGLSRAAFGILLGVGAAVGLTGSLLAGRVSDDALERMLRLGLIVFGSGVGIVVVGSVSESILFRGVALGISSGILTAGFGAASVILVTLVQRACDPDMLGRAFGVLQVAVWGTIPIGSFVGGVVAEAIGLRTTIAIFSVFLMGAAVLVRFVDESDPAAVDGDDQRSPDR